MFFLDSVIINLAKVLKRSQVLEKLNLSDSRLTLAEEKELVNLKSRCEIFLQLWSIRQKLSCERTKLGERNRAASAIMLQNGQLKVTKRQKMRSTPGEGVS